MESFDLRKWKAFKGLSESTIDQIAIDSRRIFSKNALFVALSGNSLDGHEYIKEAFSHGARYAIVRSDFSNSAIDEKLLIRVDNPLLALQEIAALYRQEMKTKVIAVVGSCGKTMTKDLLSQLLHHSFNTFSSPESFNSQIGVALSLLKIKKHHEVAIIEAAVSQPNEMLALGQMIRPDHVIVSNLGKTRPGLLGSQEMISNEILKLCSFVPKDNWCLLPDKEHSAQPHYFYWNIKDNRLPLIEPVQEKRSCYEVSFPNASSINIDIHETSAYALELIQTAISGAHLLGASHQNICKALSTYIPEQMRIEVWKSPSGATFINDTYAADPMSCDVALRQLETLENFSSKLSGKKIFLFSGLRGPIENVEACSRRIAHSINSHRVNLLVTIESAFSEKLAPHLSPHTQLICCKDIFDAIETVKAHLTPLDVVLIKGEKKIPLKEVVSLFEESPPNNQVIINLAVIQSNIEEIRAKLSDKTRIMVMVKALAYGTDDIRISKFLKTCGIDILGVSYVDEGVAMRQAGVSQSIFVLNAAEYELAKAVKWDLEIAVSNAHIVDLLQSHAQKQNKKLKVHLHVNTGMNRFGCRLEEVLTIGQKIHHSSHLVFEGIMTHFASADDPEQDQFTICQANILEKAIEQLSYEEIHPRWKHACNSSATARFHFPRFNMVRVGLAAYGLHASSASKDQLPLRPALSLISRIVDINECIQGDTVSYGRTFTVSKAQARIAVLPIGYFDGLHRIYSNKGFVRIHGKKAPMCGKICMDYMMLDISDIPEAKIGDQVLLFGEDGSGHYISPEELAELGSSIIHELMTCLGPRIRRFFIYDESLRPC